MTGEAIVQMVRLMEQNHRVGIIQRFRCSWRARPSSPGSSAVCRPPLARCVGHRPQLLAARRGELLGAQRHHPAGALHPALLAARAAWPGPLRRPDPEPRLRRGRPDAAGRLGGLARDRAGGQLRGVPGDDHRVRAARPALAAGQPAARAFPRGPGLPRRQPRAFSARDPGLPGLAAVARLPRGFDRDRGASPPPEPGPHSPGASPPMCTGAIPGRRSACSATPSPCCCCPRCWPCWICVPVRRSWPPSAVGDGSLPAWRWRR